VTFLKHNYAPRAKKQKATRARKKLKETRMSIKKRMNELFLVYKIKFCVTQCLASLKDNHIKNQLIQCVFGNLHFKF